MLEGFIHNLNGIGECKCTDRHYLLSRVLPNPLPVNLSQKHFELCFYNS